MNILLGFISVIVVSLLSLFGALFLVVKRDVLHRFLTYSIAVSSGVLLGSAFLDLLPESIEHVGDRTFGLVLVGIISFFTAEKFISWHHHIEGDHGPVAQGNTEHEKAVAYLSLLGDSMHNFVDGVVIGAAYIVSIPLGFSTTLAVIAHEIPHELSDFTILLFGGFSVRKALLYNFLSALTAVLGTAIVFAVQSRFVDLSYALLPFAAGNFIYIAASDLIPELHRKRRLGVSVMQVLAIVAGIFIIVLVRSLG